MKVTDNITYNAQWDDQLDRAINYITQTLSDVGAMYIDIKWSMQASKGQDFHHSWSADKFIEAVTSILNTQH